jgi:hypothetical protein
LIAPPVLAFTPTSNADRHINLTDVSVPTSLPSWDTTILPLCSSATANGASGAHITTGDAVPVGASGSGEPIMPVASSEFGGFNGATASNAQSAIAVWNEGDRKLINARTIFRARVFVTNVPILNIPFVSDIYYSEPATADFSAAGFPQILRDGSMIGD